MLCCLLPEVVNKLVSAWENNPEYFDFGFFNSIFEPCGDNAAMVNNIHIPFYITMYYLCSFYAHLWF